MKCSKISINGNNYHLCRESVKNTPSFKNFSPRISKRTARFLCVFDTVPFFFILVLSDASLVCKLFFETVIFVHSKKLRWWYNIPLICKLITAIFGFVIK